jgi:Tfp pilus assembly protein PilN
MVAGTEAGVRVEIQRTDARRWLDDGVATEHLAGPGMVELDAQPLVALDDDGGLMRWMEAWMAAIEAPAPAVPIIRPPRRPVPTTRIVALAIALGLLMAVAVWLARGAIETRKEAALLALGARQRPVQELADLRKRIAELKPKAEAAAAIRERQREQQRQAMERRRRCLHALASLRGACPPGTSLDEIAVAVDGGRIAGRSTTQEAATRLASTLSASLAQIGCISTPADTRIDGRVRRFTIQWAVPRERAEGEKP